MIEKILGATIGALAFLVLQGVFIKDSGFFSTAFVSILQPLITPTGTFILALFLFLLSIMLYHNKSIKELLFNFKKEIKQDLEQTKIDKEKIQQKNKNILLSIKAFFTPPSKNAPPKHTPHPLTLEELAEFSKNSSHADTQESLDETQQEDSANTQDENTENPHSSLPQTTQDASPHKIIKLQNNTNNSPQKEIKIRLIPIKEAKQQENHDLRQFQMESMMSLQRLKEFDKNGFFAKEEEEDENPIKLIKKPQTEELATQQTPKNTTTENNLPTQKTIPDTPKEQPKPIKAYPKNLYSAKPFSAYYDKEPTDSTHDCLIHPNANIPQTIQQESNNEMLEIREALKDEIDQIQKNLDEEEMKDIRYAIQDELKKAQEMLEQNASNEIEESIEEAILEQTQSDIIPQTPQKTQNLEDSIDSIEISKTPQISPTHLETPKEETPLDTQPLPQPTQETNLSTQMHNISFPSYGYGDSYTAPQPRFKAQEPIQEAPSPQQNISKQQQELIQTLQESLEQKKDITLQITPQNQETIEIQEPFNPIELPQENPNNSSTLDSTSTIENVEAAEQSQQSQQSQQNLENLENLEKPHSTQVQTLSENQALLDEIELTPQTSPISTDFILPKLDFLQIPQEERIEIDEEEIDRKINDLLSKLRMFKIEGDIVRTYSGPIVTTFEFRPSPNVKVSRILTLQDDLAMALRAKTIRIQAPVPGKDVVGIEIPNNQIQTIYLREILENELFQNSSSPLTLALGKDIVGNPFVTDLKKLPHLLIAGTTGSGKSVGINAMILSLLYKNSPDTLKLIMIDPKMLEFSIYNDIPHLLTPVITQPKQAIIALDSTVKEMERRYTLMSEARIKNIEGYNKKAEIEGFEPFPYIVVVIDELADLMMSGGKEAELSIARLAQMARASGIHLIVATQRPSVDVVTGTIKANLPSRISYKVGQKIDSKVILDIFGAESLLGRGDMLFTPPGGGIVRLHAPWSTEEEIERIVEFIKSQRPAQYDENFMPNKDENLNLRYEGEIDELYEEAKRIMLADGKTSISYIQRRLGIGYNKAANIVEQMTARGFLSEQNSKGVREIIGE